TLDVGMSADDVRSRLEELYGLDSALPVEQRITVVQSGDIYTTTFTGNAAGQHFEPLVWDRVKTGLVAKPDFSIDIGVRLARDGTPAPDLDTAQILTVDADGGNLMLKVMGVCTGPIAYNATAADIVAALQPIVDPNNSDGS